MQGRKELLLQYLVLNIKLDVMMGRQSYFSFCSQKVVTTLIGHQWYQFTRSGGLVAKNACTWCCSTTWTRKGNSHWEDKHIYLSPQSCLKQNLLLRASILDTIIKRPNFTMPNWFQARQTEIYQYRPRANGGRCVVLMFHSDPSLHTDNSDSMESTDVRVIDESGKNVGLLSKEEANDLAEKRNLVLVLLKNSGEKTPFPVFRLMNPQDLKEIERVKREKEYEKARHLRDVKNRTKEITLSSQIGEKDLDWKVDKIRKFLEEKRNVALSIRKKRRSKVTQTEGDGRKIVLDEILEKLKDIAVVDGTAVERGIDLKCVVKPKKR